MATRKKQPAKKKTGVVRNIKSAPNNQKEKEEFNEEDQPDPGYDELEQENEDNQYDDRDYDNEDDDDRW